MLTLLYLISSQYELDNRRSMWGRASTVRPGGAGHINTFPMCNSRTWLVTKITPEPNWPFSNFVFKSSAQLALPLCQDQLVAKMTTD